MNYLVLETHPAYAVVLDEEGRCLKAANLHYQVGDTVRDIVELRSSQGKRPALWKPLSGVAGLVACLCLVLFGYYRPNFTPYGALRIQINPDVELTLSRTDRVLELEGLNADGQILIAGYDYGGKDREDVTGELVERAIDLGYLSGGETVSITVSSADADWQAREEQEAWEDLEERYGETILIQIGPIPEDEPAHQVIIPVAPPTPESAPDPSPEQTDPSAVPDDTDSQPAGGATDYQDTDYGPDADGITDYEDTDYGPYSDGETDYEDRDDDLGTGDDFWDDDENGWDDDGGDYDYGDDDDNDDDDDSYGDD